MIRKHFLKLILILLILSTLLVIIINIFINNPFKNMRLTEIAQKNPLAELAVTTENIHLGLIFNNINLQKSDKLIGAIQYLWGPDRDQPISSSIYTSAYVPLDWPANNHESFDWWRVNHPDWIVYKCDKKTPAFVDATNPKSVPLDISNPAVREFQKDTYIKPFLKQGNNSIGFDNVILENYTGKCGIWRNRVWIQLYSGDYYDPAYVNEVVNWAKDMNAYIHDYSPSAGIAFNMNILASPASYHRLAPYTNIILDEGGLTNFGAEGENYVTDNKWLVQIQTIQNIIKLGKGFILNAYEPETSYSSITSQEVLWDLSNYLLIKGDHTFTYVSVNPKSPVWETFSDRLEYHALIGHPISGIYTSQGVYMRMYSNGLAIVNPSSTKIYRLSFIHPYKDIRGNTITSYTIGVHSGLILLNKQAASLAPILNQTFALIFFLWWFPLSRLCRQNLAEYEKLNRKKRNGNKGVCVNKGEVESTTAAIA